jgi:hypothetical protein
MCPELSQPTRRLATSAGVACAVWLLAACAHPPPTTPPSHTRASALVAPILPAAAPPDDPRELDWTETNRRMQALNGHVGHLRTPASRDPLQPMPAASAPMPSGHGHQHHGGPAPSKPQPERQP